MGKKKIAQNIPKHVKSSCKTPILQAGQPPITKISVGMVTMVLSVAPYIGGAVAIGWVAIYVCWCGYPYAGVAIVWDDTSPKWTFGIFGFGYTGIDVVVSETPPICEYGGGWSG